MRLSSAEHKIRFLAKAVFFVSFASARESWRSVANFFARTATKVSKIWFSSSVSLTLFEILSYRRHPFSTNVLDCSLSTFAMKFNFRYDVSAMMFAGIVISDTFYVHNEWHSRNKKRLEGSEKAKTSWTYKLSER